MENEKTKIDNRKISNKITEWYAKNINFFVFYFERFASRGFMLEKIIYNNYEYIALDQWSVIPFNWYIE